MGILVSGSSGLVGSALVRDIEAAGETVKRLVRTRAIADGSVVHWAPDRGEIDERDLTGVDGVVHLAGDGIADGRWTAAKKRRIRESRVVGTRLLSEVLARMDPRPRVLVCASAIGYYGDRGEELLTEESAAGQGFLPDVCREWEASCEPARNAGIRVVSLRIGVVLSPDGGALARMIGPFKMGLGGKLGSGRQYMSWISLPDLVGVIRFALNSDALSGPINAASPHPVTNMEFTRTLGKAIHRPTVFPMPGFAARIAFGEMADALLLSSARVKPRKLEQAGYAFRHVELASTLQELLST